MTAPSEWLIDGDAVAQAYAHTGLKPRQGMYTDLLAANFHRSGQVVWPTSSVAPHVTCGCPLGVMFVALHEAARRDEDIERWAIALLGGQFLTDFTCGFDGCASHAGCHHRRRAYRNGRALRHRFLGVDA
jgi:hypothetical protein